MERLVEALLEHESLDLEQMKRVIAGLPADAPAESAPTSDDSGSTEEVKERFKKPILGPITPNNPATA
jgi:hypothetical protein